MECMWKIKGMGHRGSQRDVKTIWFLLIFCGLNESKDTVEFSLRIIMWRKAIKWFILLGFSVVLQYFFS